MELLYYSRALYATWMVIPSLRIMFDAGDSAATYAGPGINGLENLFISHQHSDHIHGLPHLVYLRSRQSPDVPFKIYRPKGHRLDKLLAFIGNRPNVEICMIAPGDRMPIKGGFIVEAFKTKHEEHSLGFSVLEPRKRLRDDLRELEGDEQRKAIMAEKKEGKEVMEPFEVRLLSFTSDTSPDPTLADKVRDSRVLISEATYLTHDPSLPDKDMPVEDHMHSTEKDLIALHRASGSAKTYGGHISIRHKGIFDRNPQVEIEDGVALLNPFRIHRLEF